MCFVLCCFQLVLILSYEPCGLKSSDPAEPRKLTCVSGIPSKLTFQVLLQSFRQKILHCCKQILSTKFSQKQIQNRRPSMKLMMNSIQRSCWHQTVKRFALNHLTARSASTPRGPRTICFSFRRKSVSMLMLVCMVSVLEQFKVCVRELLLLQRPGKPGSRSQSTQILGFHLPASQRIRSGQTY